MNAHVAVAFLAITAVLLNHNAVVQGRGAECPDGDDLPNNAAQIRAGYDGLSDEDRYILTRIKSFMAKNGLVLAPPGPTPPPSAAAPLRSPMPSFEELMSAWVSQKQHQQPPPAHPGASTSQLFMAPPLRSGGSLYEFKPANGQYRPATAPQQILAEVPVQSVTAKSPAANVSGVVGPGVQQRDGGRSRPGSSRAPKSQLIQSRSGNKPERSPVVVPAPKAPFRAGHDNATSVGPLEPTTKRPAVNDESRRGTGDPLAALPRSNVTGSGPSHAKSNVTRLLPGAGPGRSDPATGAPTPVPSMRESTRAPNKGPSSWPSPYPASTGAMRPSLRPTTTTTTTPAPSRRERTGLTPSSSAPRHVTTDGSVNGTDPASNSSPNPTNVSSPNSTDVTWDSPLNNTDATSGSSPDVTWESLPNSTDVTSDWPLNSTDVTSDLSPNSTDPTSGSSPDVTSNISDITSDSPLNNTDVTSGSSPNVTDVTSDSLLNTTDVTSDSLPDNNADDSEPKGQSDLSAPSSDGNSPGPGPEGVPASNVTEIGVATPSSDDTENVTSKSENDSDPGPVANPSSRTSLRNVYGRDQGATAPWSYTLPSEMTLGEVKALETNRTYTDRAPSTSDSESPAPQSDKAQTDPDSTRTESEWGARPEDVEVDAVDGTDDDVEDDVDDGVNYDDEPTETFRAGDDSPMSSAVARAYV